MRDLAIRVEGLGKRYRIGQREPYYMLRDTLARVTSAPFRYVYSGLRGGAATGRDVSRSRAGSAAGHGGVLWAIRDLSFEIKRGEVVGIVGRNGAGKTTLLRILSRITEPTEGYGELHGRVGSLLEVGTGFHAELTGRENTYMNGAIIGMRKKEIDRKFDEIVAFAEIEDFIDMPVKHYSSGMYVRLAFAVAAHLEPEVLLVDEVLAVGDLQFQKKCLGKMDEVARGGRTVLFVSHQMNQIRRLCEQCIWLDRGRLRKLGTTVEVLSAYEAACAAVSVEPSRPTDSDHVAARFLRWEIVEPRSEQSNVLAAPGPVTLRFFVKVNQHIRHGSHTIALCSSEGQVMWATAINRVELNPGIRELVYRLPDLPLQPGNYFWRVNLFSESALADDWHCVPEMVIGTEPVTHPMDIFQGVLNLPCEFEVR